MNEISSGGKLKLTSLFNPCQPEHDVTTHSSLDSIAMLANHQIALVSATNIT